MGLAASVSEHFKSLIRGVWYSRSRFRFLDFAVPCRLPDGGVFLAHGDTMGWGIFSRRLPGVKGSYEESDRKFVLRFLGEGMTFFDVGANQGFYTLLAARRVAPSGRVFAFEPASTEFEKLLKNVAINRYRNVQARQTAVGAFDGETEFYLCRDGRGSFSSCRRPAEDLRAVRHVLVRVPMTTLDKLCAEQGIVRCDLIKIDVEGGELAVLKGASQILLSLRPLVICELADIRTATWNYPASEIYSFLESRGYQWFRTSVDGVLTPAARKKRYDPDWENLVAVPRERRGELLSRLPELQ